MANFIKLYKKAFTKEYCNKLIDLYEACELNGFTKTRQQDEDVPKHIKNDTGLFRNSMDIIHFPHYKEFMNIFWRIYEEYANTYSALKSMDTHKIYSIKLQKTRPGEGYHVWHHELQNRHSQARILTFILYLNDIEHGGETEFLYQSLRVKPEQGDLILWPAYFTHVHRGNPPLQETKYILTGWVEF